MSPSNSDHLQVRAVVLDWAGTTIDHGSRAPALAFVRAFAGADVDVTFAEAREPMGMSKRDHIRTMLAMPRVAARWQEVHARAADADDIDRLYEAFMPHQLAALADCRSLIPGTIGAISALRRRGIAIGSTTGYPREVMDRVEPLAREQGYVPDTVITSSDVQPGRPAPFMLFEAARRLDVYPMEAVVAVDDTVAGVAAGVNAGCWSIGVAGTGNLVGRTAAEMAALDGDTRESVIAEARARLETAGADFVIDGIDELPRLVEHIDTVLRERVLESIAG